MNKSFDAPFIRTPYNYDRDAASDESGLRCEDASLAKQSFAEECDINEIVRRFNLTGQVPPSLEIPVFTEFTEVLSMQELMNKIVAAKEAFAELDPAVRYRFHNDPAELVEFVSNDANYDEAKKLGLIFAREVNTPKDTVPAASPDAPGATPGAPAA